MEPLVLDGALQGKLERRLLLMFTGAARNSSEILHSQRRRSQNRDPGTLTRLHRIRDMVQEVCACFEAGDFDRFGELLHENWESKRQLAPGVSTPEIDSWYALARDTGAIGGKLTGAGGGGFLLLCCKEGSRGGVAEALEARGLRRMQFRLEPSGARVLMNAGQSARFSSLGNPGGQPWVGVGKTRPWLVAY